MAEGTYEYECERAELLGIDKPDLATWEASEEERRAKELEDIEIAQDAELANQSEETQGTSGKLDELNSILSMTQTKLNKFKTVCGSLTSLIKIRPGSAAGSSKDLSNDDQNNDINTAIEALDTMQQAEDEVGAAKKTVQNVGKKITSQLNALDSLLSKAERAEASMHDQNQQMKQHLKK